MAKQATIIARKSEKWNSVAVGSASEMREHFKRDAFEGFEMVWYLDTSGGHKRKKGSPSKSRTSKKGKS